MDQHSRFLLAFCMPGYSYLSRLLLFVKPLLVLVSLRNLRCTTLIESAMQNTLQIHLGNRTTPISYTLPTANTELLLQLYNLRHFNRSAQHSNLKQANANPIDALNAISATKIVTATSKMSATVIRSRAFRKASIR
jgi:hypothetical protein